MLDLTHKLGRLSGVPAIVVLALLVMVPQTALGGPISGFLQTNLVSDGFVPAAVTDPSLVNPWGITFTGTSPFWISDNGTSLSTLYNGAGVKQGLVVSLSNAGGIGSPTGIVSNGSASFDGDLFIFATEGGSIQGWRGALGTTAEVLDNNSSANAVYKGLAIGTVSSNTYLYATDFHNGQVTVFPGTGAPLLPGNFTDPNLPGGYAPFNIENIGNQLYVTYAVQDAAKHDDMPGAGNGIVDVFDLSGNFIKRLVSNGGPLDSPWGMAVAPAGFGTLGGDVLVGNFGDGTINAFSPSGTFLGTLANVQGTNLVNDGIWGLTFGDGGTGGNLNTLYLTAGLNDENDGLFASINAVPEPGTLALAALGGLLLCLRRRLSRA